MENIAFPTLNLSYFNMKGVGREHDKKGEEVKQGEMVLTILLGGFALL